MTALAIAKSLTHLFNCSLEMVALPEEWKAAHATPVHKQGEKETVGNYRPVSDSQLKWKEHIQHVRQKCFMACPSCKELVTFSPFPLELRYTMHLYYLT